MASMKGIVVLSGLGLIFGLILPEVNSKRIHSRFYSLD